MIDLKNSMLPLYDGIRRLRTRLSLEERDWSTGHNLIRGQVAMTKLGKF